MDFLNKAISQVSELFRSMTPGARITGGLLLAVVVVSVGYLFRQGASGPDEYLFGGVPLSDGQLTSIEAAFAKAGLSDFQRDHNRIRVPGAQQAKYLAAVADAGALPPNFNTIMEKALDKGGPWESREATRERLKVARQQTLSEIVRAMNWVDSAVVLYDEHESRGLRELNPTKKATASVSVKPVAGEFLTPLRVRNIRNLVAHAVNMQPNDVAVTNLGEGGTGGSDGEVNLDLFDDEYMKTKIAFESQKRESILNALRNIPGVQAEVNADFDSTIEETTHTAKPEEKTAAQRETSRDEVSTQANADNGGRPGATTQGPTRQVSSETTQQQQSKTETHTTETQSVVGVQDSRVRKKGFTPKEVWAIVSIPSSYIKDLWSANNPSATPKPTDLTNLQNAVVDKVENIVDPLLYLQSIKVGNTYRHVKVVVLDSLPAPTIEPPSMVSKAVAWSGRYWNTFAMLGVAMFSLLVLRSVVNGKPGDGTSAAAAPSASLTLQTEEAKSEVEGAASEEANRPRLRLKKGTSLKDDLVEIVREDPDAAADILRSWISKAG
jgi:flagellar M-ring protein FliF